IRLDARALAEVRHRVLRHHQRNTSWEAALRALAEAAWPQVRQGEREDFIDKFVDSSDVEAFARQWWRPLDPREVLLWLADEETALRVATGVLSEDEARLLAASVQEAERTGTWSVADAALVDDLASRLGPVTELPAEERGFYEIDELDDASQYAGVAALRSTGAGAIGDGTSYERIPANPRERLLAGRIEPAEEYAHILVDEAQDLSPMQ